MGWRAGGRAGGRCPRRLLTFAGFEEDIRRIISACPGKESRQTLMFTATWPQSVRELAATFMKAAVKITIGNRGDLRANTRIKQTVEVVDPRYKEQRLLQLIGQHQSGARKDDRILVFCLYRKEAARVEGLLRSKGWPVAGIHGDLNQAQRTRALAQFKSGACPLLVATDVAARGLDIPAVKLVINATFPLTIEDYVHRIGRTGRAGADGIAFTLFTEHDKVGRSRPSPACSLTHSARSGALGIASKHPQGRQPGRAREPAQIRHDGEEEGAFALRRFLQGDGRVCSPPESPC